MRILEGLSVGVSAIRSQQTPFTANDARYYHRGRSRTRYDRHRGWSKGELCSKMPKKLGGVNQFTMYRSRYKRVGSRWMPNRSNEYFKYEDVLAIEAECPSVKVVVPRIPEWRGVLVQAAGGAESRTGYNGVNASFSKAMDWDIQQGRFITEEDIENEAKICVLGTEVATLPIRRSFTYRTGN